MKDTKKKTNSRSKTNRQTGLDSPLGPSPVTPETTKNIKPFPDSNSQPYKAPGDTV